METMIMMIMIELLLGEFLFSMVVSYFAEGNDINAFGKIIHYERKNKTQTRKK